MRRGPAERVDRPRAGRPGDGRDRHDGLPPREVSVGSSDGLGVAAGDGSTASATGSARDGRACRDLKGSTALGERLDAETLREVMGALHRGDARSCSRRTAAASRR